MIAQARTCDVDTKATIPTPIDEEYAGVSRIPESQHTPDAAVAVAVLDCPLEAIRGLDAAVAAALLGGSFDEGQLSLPIPVVAWAIDPVERRLLSLSPSAASVYGRPLQELLAEPQLLWTSVVEEDQREWSELLTDLARTGLIERLYRMRRGDGEIRWMFGRTALVRDEAGVPLRIEGVHQDVTEQMKSGPGVGFSSADPRVLSDVLPAIVFEVDVQGRITYANRQAMETTGYDAAAVRDGLHSLTMFAAENRAEIVEYFERARAGHVMPRREFVIRRHDGSDLHTFGQASAMTRAGEVVGLRGVLLDITERKLVEQEQQERREQLNRHRRAFERIASDTVLHEGSLNEALSRVCGIAAEALQVANVVYRELDAATGCLQESCPCVTSPSDEGLDQICARRYPAYFQAITENLVVDAHDALTDSRLGDFAADVLAPRGVTSFLATAVRMSGEVRGVIACEHMGQVRHWSAEESSFLAAIAEQAAYLIEHAGRRRVEHELEMFKAISDHASYGVVVVDLNGVMIYLNRAYAAMHQVEVADAVGRHYSVFHDEAQIVEIDRLNGTLRSESGYLAREIWHRRADGGIFPALMNTTVVRDASGRARFIAATAHDITERKVQDEALQEERRRLSTLIASLPGMVFRVRNEPDWPVEYLSEGSLELTGWRPEELINNQHVRHTDVVHPEDQPMVWAAMEESLAQHRPYEVEYRITTRDGQVKWVWEQGLGVYEDGELVAAEGFVTDIDERIRQQQDLRLKQFTLDHVNDAVLWLTADGHIIDANATACSMYGRSSERLRELDIFGLTPEYSRESWAEQWRHLREYGSLRKEYVHQLGDGRIIPVEVSANHLRFENRELMCALVRDITARKRAEEHIRELNRGLEQRVEARTSELSESRERYRLLVESLRDQYIFYSLDRHGDFTYVSPSIQCVLGIPEEGFSVEVLSGVLSGEQLEHVRSVTADALCGRERPHFEIEVTRPDGERCVLEVMQVPVSDGDGRVVSVEGIAHDITAHKHNLSMIHEQQDQLLQAEKMAALGRMVAGVTHEVNTPIGLGLTATTHLQDRIVNLTQDYESQTMKRSDLESFLADADETVRIVLGNLGKAVELIQGFKGVAVDQSDEACRRFDLKQYLEESLLNLRPELKRTRHELVLNCPEGVMVDSYPGALSHVVTNLVMNSLIHGFAGKDTGRIVIDVEADDETVRLVYRDDGVGMTEEVCRQIYEPFFTTRRGEGGSGLGMHLVYTSITSSLGGTINCESRPGQGVRFDVEFPLSHRSRDVDA